MDQARRSADHSSTPRIYKCTMQTHLGEYPLLQSDLLLVALDAVEVLLQAHERQHDPTSV